MGWEKKKMLKKFADNITTSSITHAIVKERRDHNFLYISVCVACDNFFYLNNV